MTGFREQEDLLGIRGQLEPLDLLESMATMEKLESKVVLVSLVTLVALAILEKEDHKVRGGSQAIPAPQDRRGTPVARGSAVWRAPRGREATEETPESRDRMAPGDHKVLVDWLALQEELEQREVGAQKGHQEHLETQVLLERLVPVVPQGQLEIPESLVEMELQDSLAPLESQASQAGTVPPVPQAPGERRAVLVREAPQETQESQASLAAGEKLVPPELLDAMATRDPPAPRDLPALSAPRGSAA